MDDFVSECLTSIDEYKNSLALSNELASVYNNKIEEKIAQFKSQGKEDEIHALIALVPRKLDVIDASKAIEPHPEDYVEDENEPDDDWDEYDKYDDFGLQGSKNRQQKGTGKGNYKDPYTQKHVRTIESRLANKKK